MKLPRFTKGQLLRMTDINHADLPEELEENFLSENLLAEEGSRNITDMQGNSVLRIYEISYNHYERQSPKPSSVPTLTAR